MTKPLLDKPGTPDLDPTTAERMLGGRMTADDAPPGYGRVADLLAAAATVPNPVVSDDLLVTRMLDVSHAATLVPVTPAGPRARLAGLSRLDRTRIAAGAGVLALLAGGVAAATGNLPRPAQDGVARVAANLGLDLPSSDDRRRRPVPPPPNPDMADEAGLEDLVPGDDPVIAPADPAANDHGQAVSDVARDPNLSGGARGPAVSGAARPPGPRPAGGPGPAGPAPGRSGDQPGAPGEPGRVVNLGPDPELEGREKGAEVSDLARRYRQRPPVGDRSWRQKLDDLDNTGNDDEPPRRGGAGPGGRRAGQGADNSDAEATPERP